MSRTLWPLAALATVALIGAGCSNGSAENGKTGTGTARSSGTTSSTSTASEDVPLAVELRGGDPVSELSQAGVVATSGIAGVIVV